MSFGYSVLTGLRVLVGIRRPRDIPDSLTVYVRYEYFSEPRIGAKVSTPVFKQHIPLLGNFYNMSFCIESIESIEEILTHSSCHQLHSFPMLDGPFYQMYVSTLPASQCINMQTCLHIQCLKIIPTNLGTCSSLQAGSNPYIMVSPSAPVMQNPSREPPDM